MDNKKHRPKSKLPLAALISGEINDEGVFIPRLITGDPEVLKALSYKTLDEITKRTDPTKQLLQEIGRNREPTNIDGASSFSEAVETIVHKLQFEDSRFECTKHGGDCVSRFTFMDHFLDIEEKADKYDLLHKLAHLFLEQMEKEQTQSTAPDSQKLAELQRLMEMTGQVPADLFHSIVKKKDYDA